MDKSKYHHKIYEQVKFHEVDVLGVCNNAVYFNYFEDARIKYIQDLKKSYEFKEFLEGNSFFIMAHNEIDYLEPAYLDDELCIHTRVEFVGKSSMGFLHLVEKRDIGKIIAEGSGVVVHINKETKKVVPLPQEFYDVIRDFDSDVKINKE